MMLFAICILVICGVMWWAFTRDEENPLEQLPGPPRKPIVGNTFQMIGVKPDDFFQEILKFTSQFGERYVFKIMGMWVLHINNPGDIEVVMSHSKNITKSLTYNFLEPWLGTGLLLSTGKKWYTRRKILTPTFHFNILKSYFITMEEKSRNLVSTLRKSNGNDVDLLPVISEFTLYAICETAMGTQLDSDQSTASVEYKNAIMNIGLLLLSRITNVWLHYDFIFKRTKLGKYFKNCLQTVDTFAANVIRERKKHHMTKDEKETVAEDGSKKRLAMLDLLLEAERKGDIDFEGIREEVNTFMFEGHDTTAIALTFSLMLLADHEDVQDQIYEECQRIYVNCDGKPSMSDFSEMKYLEAVIKESLRLYPSAPIIARNVDEDFMMRDLFVKKGTEISMHLYSLHRREDLFPDPETFRPERFLEGELKHPYAFVPFSAGPRNCIGQRFAMLEMKSVLYEIIRNFKLVPKVKGWRPPLTAAMVLKPLAPIYVKFIPRHSKEL